MLAVAIKAGMTAFDLTEIDLAYAPPYASAKDPVNMAGYVIENILEDTVTQIHWDKALTIAATDTNAVILDTRTQAEFDRRLHVLPSFAPRQKYRNRKHWRLRVKSISWYHLNIPIRNRSRSIRRH